jgi:hypothetical protein
MIQKLKNKLLILASALALAVPMLVPAAANAAAYTSNNLQSSLCQGTVLNVNEATSSSTAACQDSTGGTGGLNNLLKKVVNIISGIVGVIAVIMIVFGGFKYITSGGDSNNVSGAKNTIIYAIIGLIIVALAQLIVHFVLTQAAGV